MCFIILTVFGSEAHGTPYTDYQILQQNQQIINLKIWKIKTAQLAFENKCACLPDILMVHVWNITNLTTFSLVHLYNVAPVCFFKVLLHYSLPTDFCSLFLYNWLLKWTVSTKLSLPTLYFNNTPFALLSTCLLWPLKMPQC